MTITSFASATFPESGNFIKHVLLNNKAFFLLMIAATAFSSVAKCQPAIIKDKDGYSNVRAESSIGSKVNDTLASERVVYFFEEGSDKNWAYIDYNKSGHQKSGYIHRSRIKPLDSLRIFKPIIVREGNTKLSLDSFQFSIVIKKFDPAAHRISRVGSGEAPSYINGIDGGGYWGTDGDMPRKEYQSILFIHGRDSIVLPRKAFSNLFEPRDSSIGAYHDPATGKFYLECNNSDAAGAYVVVWIFNKKELIGREIFIPF